MGRMNQNSPGSARSDRKKKRDKRVAALSLHLGPLENRRTTRIATQELRADELHEAISLCLKEGLLMSIASLLRSMIDTTVRGLWFLKYSPEDRVTESVSDLRRQS